jgi:hypothetical protein
MLSSAHPRPPGGRAKVGWLKRKRAFAALDHPGVVNLLPIV